MVRYQNGRKTWIRRNQSLEFRIPQISLNLNLTFLDMSIY